MVSAQEIKHIRSLKYKKYRIYYNQFIIEGTRSLLAATESKERLIKVYISESYQKNNNWGHIEKNLNDTSTYIIPDNIMVKLTDIKTPPGIIGICSIPERQVPDINSLENWLYLDKIRDPGNVGTILRTAAWFGVKNVALSPESIDIYNPKVVRGAMGAHFHLPIEVLQSSSMPERLAGLNVWLAEAGEGQPYYEIEWRQPVALVIGSETHGPQPSLRSFASGKVNIPMMGKSESLNAAVAAAVILFEILRQREST